MVTLLFHDPSNDKLSCRAVAKWRISTLQSEHPDSAGRYAVNCSAMLGITFSYLSFLVVESDSHNSLVEANKGIIDFGILMKMTEKPFRKAHFLVNLFKIL